MSVFDYASLLTHVGHDVEVVTYGRADEEPINVAIECVDCGCVLLDYDHPLVEKP